MNHPREKEGHLQGTNLLSCSMKWGRNKYFFSPEMEYVIELSGFTQKPFVAKERCVYSMQV